MKFNENLIELRKKQNLTQEDLATKMNVSRQTIYKWETGATYPDTDKLIDLAKVFNVSVDQLINGDVKEEVILKDDVIKIYRSFARAIAISVGLMIFGIAVLIFMSMNNNETETILGTIIMLFFIFVGTIWIILSSLRKQNFVKENVSISVEFTKQERERDNKGFYRDLIIGLSTIFVGILEVIFFSLTNDDNTEVLAVSIMFVLIAIGVGFIIYGSINHSIYLQNTYHLSEENKNKTILDAIPGIIMLIATCCFFVWGFCFQGWDISWVCFVVGGILCAIWAIIYKYIKKK